MGENQAGQPRTTLNTSSSPAVLEMRAISKSFAGNEVLHHIDLELHQGVILALLGENGAGKSTLMKILSGAHGDYDGEIRLDGKSVRFGTTRDAENHGIAMIYQELNLVPELTVAENIFLGREPRTAFGLLDQRLMEQQSAELLGELEFNASPGARVADLRVGEQQIVEIAKAVSRDARILIMDEPTSALSEAEAEVLFRLVRTLRDKGVSIIYISHRMDEIFGLATAVSVLRDGFLVGTLAIDKTERGDLIRLMVGREVGEFFTLPHEPQDEVVLEVSDLWLENTSPYIKRDYLVRHIAFKVRAGEVLGIGGLLGAGRSEILATLFGAAQGICGGDIAVRGRSVKIRNPREARENGMAYVTEDRKASGLVPWMRLDENISLASIGDIAPGGLISRARERRLTAGYSGSLGIRASGPDQAARTLSGGNQQKVVLAKWLATNPSVLLLDEPTRGVDVGAKADIYELLAQLSGRGMAIVLVSSDMPELVSLSRRILVLREGLPTAMLEKHQIDPHTILEYAAPGGPVQPAYGHLFSDGNRLSA